MPAHRLTPHVIDNEAQLRALIGSPAAQTCAKITDRLNALTRQFIERSPFLCVATSDAQAYLLDELRGDFHGLRRDYQYLSDGGHFENTAVYELLRPQRKVRLIVVTDCGADPDYGFEDLANLMRLARIDHQVELRVNHAVVEDPAMQGVFGTPADLARPEATEPCAMLVDAHAPGGELQARLIVIKPRLVREATVDLLQYRKIHPDFPQQPTGDQFYDEAQWESYRKLGLGIAAAVFGADDDARRDALWAYLAPAPAPLQA